MNSRIKELMDAAVTFRLDPDSNAHEAQVHPEDLELFAELIVRECADFLDAFNCENMVEEGMDGAHMKKHFGVEE